MLVRVAFEEIALNRDLNNEREGGSLQKIEKKAVANKQRPYI